MAVFRVQKTQNYTIMSNHHLRKAYDLTPAGIIKQLNLQNPIYSRTAAGGHFGREDFPWENIERMSDLAAYIV